MNSIEVRKIAYRQSAKDGLVITFAVHPNDMPAELAAAPIGARFAAALVEIGDDEKPVERKTPPADHRIRRAAMLCNDPKFQRYMGADSEKTARDAICKLCRIESRKYLSNHEAAALFDQLTANFEMWKRGQ